MKTCPACRLANEERFPACLWCNTVLVDVRSELCANPDDPEYRRQKLSRERQELTRRQIASATVGYIFATTFLAVCPGLVFDPLVLLLYAGTSLVVALAMHRGWVGQFTSSFLQGALSLVLVLGYGPIHPLTFGMLLGHVILPMVFWHWTEMIHEANR